MLTGSGMTQSQLQHLNCIPECITKLNLEIRLIYVLIKVNLILYTQNIFYPYIYFICKYLNMVQLKFEFSY